MTVKLQYLKQRIGDLVSAYEGKIGDLYEENDALKAELAKYRAMEEEKNALVQEEGTTDGDSSIHSI